MTGEARSQDLRKYEHDAVYPDRWRQVGGNILGAAGTRAGVAVSISSDGTRVAVSFYAANSHKGLIRVYEESFLTHGLR